ncbi:MAG: PEP-CTERM sorting domain-containing protein, partial [Chthoniobacteraceae bacterium]
RFTNTATGIFNKSGAGTTTLIQVPFDNAGTVHVASGTLTLGGGGTSSGAFSVDALARLTFGIFSGSPYTLTAASSVSGAGNVSFDGGINSFAGSYEVGGTTTVNEGTANFNSPSTTAAGAITGGTLGGSGAFEVSGDLLWTGGTMGGAGTTTVAGTLAISGANTKSLGNGGNTGRILINNGTANLSGGNLAIGDSGGANPGAQFDNRGTFNATGEADITGVGFGGSAARFTNTATGIFNKSGAGTTTAIQVPFTNAGTVSADGGTLTFSGPFTQTAGRTVLNGGSISTSTTLTFVSGSLSGTGMITGNVSNGGTLAPGFSAGSIAISGDLSLGSNSHYDLEIGGTVQGASYDFVSEGGAVPLTLDGTIALSLLNGFVPGSADTFTVLTSNQPLLGGFIGLPSGSRITAADGMGSFQIEYGAGSAFDPNSVVFSAYAVPEPSSALLAGLGAALLGLRRYRRQGDFHPSALKTNHQTKARNSQFMKSQFALPTHLRAVRAPGPFSLFFESLAAIALLASATSTVKGALLMEEAFDGPGYDLGATTLAGLSGGTGFGGPWISNGNGSRTIVAGLAFGDYPVSGNAITYAPSSTSVGDRRDIGDFSIVATGGELWMSYLSVYNFGPVNGGASMLTDDGNGSSIFSLQRGNGGATMGLVGVDNTLVAASGVSTGVTILMIARFDNFGLGSMATPQLGTYWALSQANYDAIKSGGITEAELIANNLATATDSVTVPISYSTTTNVVIGAGSVASGSLTLDELRWGTDLQFIMVPEPSSALLAGLGAALLGLRRSVARRSIKSKATDGDPAAGVSGPKVRRSAHSFMPNWIPAAFLCAPLAHDLAGKGRYHDRVHVCRDRCGRVRERFRIR